jgi:hypothetical protein
VAAHSNSIALSKNSTTESVRSNVKELATEHCRGTANKGSLTQRKYTMFKAQYKSRSSYESWNTLGSYNSEANAITNAIQKKERGALLVRVVDKRSAVVFVY